jgi:hypothetical protein
MKRIKRLGLGVANRLVPLIPLRSRLERLINTRWYDFPFGRQPHASQEEYLQRAAEARQQRYPEIEAYEQQTGFALDADQDAEWLHELALHTQVVIKKSPLCYAHGRVLYSA